MNIKEEIKNAVAEALDERKAATKRNLVTGLQGLADLLGVSYSTAYRIKRSKVLAKATFQVNRTIAFDADMVLSILCEANQTYHMRGRVNITK
jgi:hypothetical protein